MKLYIFKTKICPTKILYKAFDKRMNDELHRLDLKILNDFEKKVSEQQETLQKSGVYGFFPSKDPKDIKIQMYLLSFIQKLNQIVI